MTDIHPSRDLPELKQPFVFVQVGVPLAMGEKGGEAFGLGFEQGLFHQVLVGCVVKPKLQEHHLLDIPTLVAAPEGQHVVGCEQRQKVRLEQVLCGELKPHRNFGVLDGLECIERGQSVAGLLG